MSRRRTRIGRTAAVALLIAMLSAGAVAKGASEPSPSAEIGRWPTGVEPLASLAPVGWAPPIPMPSLSAAGSSVVLSVEAREFAFSPAELTIPALGTSKIVLHDAGRIVHNFTVDALDVQVVASAGGSGEVTIVDPGPGVYEFYCSISGHRESGMVGTLTVE